MEDNSFIYVIIYCSSSKFHSNLHFESKVLEKFPSFYEKMVKNWQKYFFAPPTTPSCILSQFLWYDSYIKIGKKAVYSKTFSTRNNKIVYLKIFSTKNINLITKLFNSDGSLKNWNLYSSLVSAIDHLLT